jgi:hypothetical protein
MSVEEKLRGKGEPDIAEEEPMNEVTTYRCRRS